MRTLLGSSSAFLLVSIATLSCGGDSQPDGTGGAGAVGPTSSANTTASTGATSSTATTTTTGSASGTTGSSVTATTSNSVTAASSGVTSASSTTTGSGGASSSTAATTGSGGAAASSSISSSSAGTGGGTVAGNEAVLQHHNHENRDGVYTQPKITPTAAAAMHVDATFKATIQGNVYAQPLYVEDGPGGKGIFIVVTESNNVHAVDETGAKVWTTNVGTPAGASGAACAGNIAVKPNTMGITSTPAIDLPSRTLYVAAVIGNATTILRHEIHALSIDDGTEKAGYPIDTTKLTSGGITFDAKAQNQRGALLIDNGTLYVPYGGHAGDCDDYHGWVVGVPLGNPAGVAGWVTSVRAGGVWAVGGLASDGTDVFAATGNTYTIGQMPPNDWEGGDAIIRFKGLPSFMATEATKDYFYPSNWRAMDQADQDMGGTGAVVVDVPGATPSALMLGLGKNGIAYLLDRSNLGGMGKGNGTTGEGLQSANVATSMIMNAPTIYTTAQGTYVVFNTTGTGNTTAGTGKLLCPGTQTGNLVALKIAAANPPTMSVAWCANNQGRGSPITTTTDGTANALVWTMGSGTSNRLHAFNGDTGAVVYTGGGANDMVTGFHYFNSPIAAKGRIIVAVNNNLVAFTSP